MKTTGENYNPILEEIAEGFWEHEADVATPFKFPPEALNHATKIVMTVMMDRLWNRIKDGDIKQPIAERMAEDMGTEFREFVKKWTFVDLHDFHK